MKQYDYIISGAGAAGFSLLMRLMLQPAFAEKQILVVDKAPKSENDHTWCFWEKQAGLFEPVVHHKWQKVHFYSNDYSSLLDLSPYEYKMIRSIDFYNYVYNKALQHTNVHIMYGQVEAAGNAGSNAFVLVNGQQYFADYVFNSIMFQKAEVPLDKYFLLQHFKGFLVETNAASFNPQEATLMDFKISQRNRTSFVYVLPLAENRALIEYTLFSKNLLHEDEYVSTLRSYIENNLSIKDYSVIDEEFGVIPMTNMKFVKKVDRVINIGTAGGQTKGSSGYTFQFIQKHSEKLVTDLLQFGHLKEDESFFKKRFDLYDSTLLNILSGNKMPGDKIFSDLFKKNPTERVLRFLDNETTLEDEINLMATMQQGVFMKAAFQEFFR